MHLALALVAGGFILILGLTGAILAFEPEIDRLRFPHLSYVEPAGRVLSLNEIAQAIARQFGAEPIVAYLPSASPALSYAVIMPRGIVYVNQYTGEVLGTRTRGQTFLGLARELHVSLASGDLGREIMKWSAVAALVSLASGLFLWWRGKRVRIRNWRRAGFAFDFHNSIGILSLLSLLVLAATGLVIGFYEVPDRPASHNTPRLPVAPGAPIITPDEAVTKARARIPGAIPYRVQMPKYGGAYRVSLDDPRDKVAGGQNLVVIDPYSGSVISSARSSDLASGARFLATNQAIHTGEVFGKPGRMVAWLTSIAAPVQVVSGVWLWLRRKRIGRKKQ